MRFFTAVLCENRAALHYSILMQYGVHRFYSGVHLKQHKILATKTQNLVICFSNRRCIIVKIALHPPESLLPKGFFYLITNEVMQQ